MNTKTLTSNLEKRGFTVQCFDASSQAVDYLKQSIKNTSVALGGSITLKELNLFEALAENNEIWWHGKGIQLKEFGAAAVMKNAMNTEIYVTSANAVSLQGQLINIDGRGNRVASTLFGHKKVYFVIGKNKIAPTFEDAMFRARNIAAPKNAQRLGMNTPCAIKGDKCYDCSCTDRICRGFVVLEMPPMDMEVEIIIINENLGF